MTEILDAETPLWGHALPETQGAATLAVVADTPVASVAPYRGRGADVARVLSERHGVGLPGPGGSAAGSGATCRWAGLDQWFLFGPEPAAVAEALSGLAAVTDQSDGWARLALTGGDAAAVMARLCPLDLHPVAFPEGATARTEFAHMMSAITAIPGGVEVMVMRSFAGTAVHEIIAAMRSVAAQKPLR